VELAAQGTTSFRHCRATLAFCASVFFALVTHLTYWPWFFHGTVPAMSLGKPAQGQSKSIAVFALATANSSQVGAAEATPAIASRAKNDNALIHPVFFIRSPP
jgi:hypothetical protein